VVHAKETMEKEAHTLTAPSATEAFSEAVVPDTRQPWINTLLIAIPALILPLLVLFQGDFNPAQRDFAVLYSAGQAVLQTPEKLFSIEAHSERTIALASHYGVHLEGSTTPWLYPAVTAWLYAPLSMISFPTAFYLITTLNILALVTSFYLISLHLDARDCRILGFFALVTPAITGTIIHGQAAIFTVLLIAMAMREKSELRQGLWIGLLALKPLFVLQMLGWLALKRNWRGLGLAIAIAFLLLIASIVTTGVDGFVAHLSLLNAVSTHSLNAAEITSQPTVNGLRMSLGLHWSVWFGITTLIAAALIAMRHTRNFDPMTLIGAILVAPYMHNTESGMMALFVATRMLSLGSHWSVCLTVILAAGWITGVSLTISVAILCGVFFYLMSTTLQTSPATT